MVTIIRGGFIRRAEMFLLEVIRSTYNDVNRVRMWAEFNCVCWPHCIEAEARHD